MDPDRDFDPDLPEPATADDVRRDLELDFLWDAMAAGDGFLRAVARAATVQSVTDPAVIAYRQDALADTIEHPDAVDEVYAVAMDALSVRRGILTMPVRGHPELTLSHSVRMLTALAERLERLHEVCGRVGGLFRSRAFRELCAVVATELDETYLSRLRGHLAELEFGQGMLMSAGVGRDGQVVRQVLRRPKRENRGFFDRTPLRRPRFGFAIPERDEAGFTALAELRARSVADVSAAAEQSVDHVLGFFLQLRIEIAFYLSVRTLRTTLAALGVPVCLPAVSQDPACTAEALCDPCLALRASRAPVGNDLDLHDGRVLVITGANHGGKSTFLRALGVAQLMAQAGMVVAARRFSCPVVHQVLTHWTREEDAELRHGKLDEELDRMSRLIDLVQPGDLLLCNESFASTNEAEGSQIALEVTSALVRAGVRVRYVTHMYDFAHAVEQAGLGAEFLRAPRDAAGTRSYRLEAGPPLPTSFGVDLYDRVFGTSLAQA
ncbi:MutS-related protein [Microbacterium luticocti]|uniref:MutS-related protein n=1 Tax=Microbacterium luticocti TaxID=451764 RepID=UPI00146C194A|nr:DNA mismatch repair protein MutS [Microbacterium luticocti]